MQPTQTSALEKSISRFANTLAALAAIFFFPYVEQHLRGEVLAYLLSSLSYSWAYFGSWVFVGLIGLGIYFGGSTLLQMGVYLLFHRSIRKREF